MRVCTDRLRQLRDRFSIGYDLLRFAPQEVFNTGRDLTSLLNELIEFREAEELAMQQDAEMLFGEPEKDAQAIDFNTGQPTVIKVGRHGVTREEMRVPLKGTVA